MNDAISSSAVYEVLVEALTHSASEQTVTSVMDLARSLEVLTDEYILDWDDPKKAFVNRLLVAISPTYIPARESYMRAASVVEGRWTIGAVLSGCVSDVVHRYRSAAFDWKKLDCDTLLANSLKPDHIIVELAFMGYLRATEAEGGMQGELAAKHARSFLENHLLRWTETLTHYAAWQGKDYYALVFAAVDAWSFLDYQADDPT